MPEFEPRQILFKRIVMGIRPYSLLSLNDLRDKIPRKQKTRKVRGIGSGKGKTAGRGHKKQSARGSVKLGFVGGQAPMRRRLPKRGFKNPFSLVFQPVGLGKNAYLINAGKIDSHELITMKTLKDAGAIGKQIKDGVRLTGRGAEKIKWPIHPEVSRVTVTTSWVCKLCLSPSGLRRRGGCCQGLLLNRKIKLIALATCLHRPNLFHSSPKRGQLPPHQPSLQMMSLLAPTLGFCISSTETKTSSGQILISRNYLFLFSFINHNEIFSLINRRKILKIFYK
ncbi:50S ribosomal protein L15-like [Mangifera indica]|uniref:50S ribosomal protein L15-like n=1 Tax=Mangifera indica TaxID=29780 RepID=UPI001CFB3D1C|nr:50S ribosomal protein L15-like [Mangifera indica]